MEKLPEIDFKELEREKELNRKQRLEFIRQYAEWLKKTPNKERSRRQNVLLD